MIYIRFRKNKETILSLLQACFMITHLSGDFNKEIPKDMLCKLITTGNSLVVSISKFTIPE